MHTMLQKILIYVPHYSTACIRIGDGMGKEITLKGTKIGPWGTEKILDVTHISGPANLILPNKILFFNI